MIPTHQGRAAEKILFSITGGKGKIFLSNTLFDTTRANIEFSGAEGIDLLCDEGNISEVAASAKERCVCKYWRFFGIARGGQATD